MPEINKQFYTYNTLFIYILKIVTYIHVSVDFYVHKFATKKNGELNLVFL